MDVNGSIKIANGMMVKNVNNNNNNIEPESQTVMNDIEALITMEIPECQQNLKDNHRNLERVAEYCDTNYFRAIDKTQALEETKNYTIQSLASVAYQITTLSYHILHLLEFQATQVIGLESRSNHLAQTEQIHREKVARREIGLFTANKRPNRIPKLIYPANPERPTKYVRKVIDYSILDDVGHGVKLAPSQQLQQQTQLHTSRTRSISSAQSINGGSTIYAPGTSVSGVSIGSSIPGPYAKPPTPPQPIRSAGSLSRSSKEFRNTALSIAPPQVPSNYAPNYPITHLNSAPNMMQQQQQQQSLYGQLQQQPQQQQSQQNYNQQAQYKVGMVQPLTHTGNSAPAFNVYSTGTIRYGQSPLPPPPPTFERVLNEPDWVPKNYIEKVIALYDYTKEKPDELNLCENAIIYVTKKNEDGWYEGVLDGEEGLFPCNYVEPLRDY